MRLRSHQSSTSLLIRSENSNTCSGFSTASPEHSDSLDSNHSDGAAAAPDPIATNSFLSESVRPRDSRVPLDIPQDRSLDLTFSLDESVDLEWDNQSLNLLQLFPDTDMNPQPAAQALQLPAAAASQPVPAPPPYQLHAATTPQPRLAAPAQPKRASPAPQPAAPAQPPPV